MLSHIDEIRQVHFYFDLLKVKIFEPFLGGAITELGKLIANWIMYPVFYLL